MRARSKWAVAVGLALADLALYTVAAGVFWYAHRAYGQGHVFMAGWFVALGITTAARAAKDGR